MYLKKIKIQFVAPIGTICVAKVSFICSLIIFNFYPYNPRFSQINDGMLTVYASKANYVESFNYYVTFDVFFVKMTPF